MIKRMKTPNWDAIINTNVCDHYNNAELVITLKPGFRQINPKSGASKGTFPDYGDPKEKHRKIIKWKPKACP